MAEAADRGADPPGSSSRRPRSGSARTARRGLRAAGRPVSAPGPAAAAKQTGVALVAGVFEPSPGRPRRYNTAVVYDGATSLVTAYRKLHPFDAFGHRVVRRGWRRLPAPVALPHARRGPRRAGDLLRDVRFGELSPGARGRPGPSCSVPPAAWAAGLFKEEHWVTLVRAALIENTARGSRPARQVPDRTKRRPRPRPASGAACWSTRSAWSAGRPRARARRDGRRGRHGSLIVATVRASPAQPGQPPRRDGAGAACRSAAHDQAAS